MTLPELDTLKPEDDTLTQGLILILKLSYNISEADAERVHQLSLCMFHDGCIVGAKTVLAAAQAETKLHKAALELSSSLLD